MARASVINSNSGSEGELGLSHEWKLTQYTTKITVANGATTGKESAIAMPAHFMPTWVAVTAENASTNACNLVDVGNDADTDDYVDGAALAVGQSAGFKGILSCNGLRGTGNGIDGALAAADEVEIVISTDPGANTLVLRLDFFGIGLK